MKPQFEFHIGYYDNLHSEPSINFQLNRWINYLGQDAIADIEAISSKLINIQSYQSEFRSLAEQALGKGEKLQAAYYLRSAEFFMKEDDPDKKKTRQKFIQLIRDYFSISEKEYFEIPFMQNGKADLLPAYFFTHTSPKDTLVIHGGFDSYIEEFFPIILSIRDQGFNVICFDGPGQGGAFCDSGLLLTSDWHRPVGSVLDYFKENNVTLIGISMGACLALRAAAFEKRVKRVVAYDVFYDWMETTLSKLTPIDLVLRILMKIKNPEPFNNMLGIIMNKSPLFEWAMHQAMPILGVSTAYEVFQKSRSYTTRDISSKIDQDVLIMAGAEDHIIPIKHFYQQINILDHARSKNSRLFTRAENAQNHCQIGNLKLAIDTIIQWIESTSGKSL